jgi:hypothetical protein
MKNLIFSPCFLLFLHFWEFQIFINKYKKIKGWLLRNNLNKKINKIKSIKKTLPMHAIKEDKTCKIRTHNGNF